MEVESLKRMQAVNETNLRLETVVYPQCSAT